VAIDGGRAHRGRETDPADLVLPSRGRAKAAGRSRTGIAQECPSELQLPRVHALHRPLNPLHHTPMYLRTVRASIPILPILTVLVRGGRKPRSGAKGRAEETVSRSNGREKRRKVHLNCRSGLRALVESRRLVQLHTAIEVGRRSDGRSGGVGGVRRGELGDEVKEDLRVVQRTAMSTLPCTLQMRQGKRNR